MTMYDKPSFNVESVTRSSFKSVLIQPYKTLFSLNYLFFPSNSLFSLQPLQGLARTPKFLFSDFHFVYQLDCVIRNSLIL